MSKHRKHIPNVVQIGGQLVYVINVDETEDEGFASSSLATGEIHIADVVCKNFKQSPYSKINSYYHELIHLILNNMGYGDTLSSDEKFVCAFAGFLTEAMVTAEFADEITDVEFE